MAGLGITSLLGAKETEAAKKCKKDCKGPSSQPDPVCRAGTLVANLAVGGNGVVVQMPVLTQGQAYTFQASGAAALSSAFSFDAEYVFSNADPSAGVDVDSGIDVGLSIDDPTVDNSKSPRWGPYNPSHVYETRFIGKGGTGATLDARRRLHR